MRAIGGRVAAALLASLWALAAWGCAPPPAPAMQPNAPSGGASPSPTQPGASQLNRNADAPSLRLWQGMEEAEQEIQASLGDCAAACRALASMERSTAGLCALSERPDDQRRCEDAKQRVLHARERVRSQCTACPPGGPSLDPDAPIPSMSLP